MYEENRIIELARQLGKEIQKEQEYLEFIKAGEANDADTVLQENISAFNMSKMNLSRALGETERDEEKIKKYTDEINSYYNEIMTNENFQQYVLKKTYMEGLLKYINRIVEASMNGEDPDLVGEPTECTHDCSTCGGCG